nr:glycosyltransferase [Sedimentibacter sp.]
MNRYKICVYGICKNEEQFVDRWMDAVSEADMVIVTDTGSTDNTVEKLRKRGAIVYTDIIKPWRFDVARNTAMDHIPEDIDICVSNDLDEVFESGWREKLEAEWMPFHTRARYMFTWSYNSDGSPNKQYPMEKIHCRNGYRWVHPVHEILEYNDKNKERCVVIKGLTLNHYPDTTKPRSQYLPLLKISAEENPNDDRVMFWLGREYMYYNMYDESISTLNRYLKMRTAIWNEERSAAMRFISKCYTKKGNSQLAKEWLFKAISECPKTREPYLYMARYGYGEKDWPLVYMMVNEALKITEKTGSYLLETSSWDQTFYDLGAICTYHLGLYDKSYDFAKKACEMDANNERLKQNLELIKLKLK